eukprot:CAMPEP_0206626916 /NCGR_PEP_ID=MMETSP0325_2-20121206/65608_1 /ASSEMBLY_ACC=CAM_ASM_000347 /TAXON_ID=2866 /ORGANISM="Crypthecodinium cohnii, Strain Seligo" /LENGTH=83 /DNA_ID=CAMNT_0054151367 /DNA_START=205 /DNA_END=453 /DNA_ORIENTATION=-
MTAAYPKPAIMCTTLPPDPNTFRVMFPQIFATCYNHEPPIANSLDPTVVASVDNSFAVVEGSPGKGASGAELKTLINGLASLA